MAVSTTEARLAEVRLRQVSTQTESSCVLDVDPGIVVEDGDVLKDVTFTFLQESVEEDPELTKKQRSALQFEPVSEGNSSPPSSGERPPVKIGKALKGYAKEMMQRARSDPVIKDETNKIIKQCLPTQGTDQTDSGPQGASFDFQSMWEHIKEVFNVLMAPDSSEGTSEDSEETNVIRVLTQLGAGLGYCCYLIKRLVVTYLEIIGFKDVVFIICKVISHLFRHLLEIQFGSLLQKIGGMNTLTSIIAAQSTDTVLRKLMSLVPIEYLFLVLGITSIAVFGYLKFVRR